MRVTLVVNTEGVIVYVSKPSPAARMASSAPGSPVSQSCSRPQIEKQN
jgi:hypothetical protein